MGVPSFQASNAIIYLTYGAFLYVRLRKTTFAALNLENRVFGLFVAWRLRHQSKLEFLSSNRTQKG